MPLIGADRHIRRLKKLASAATTKRLGRVLFVGADMIKADAQHSITEGAVSGKGHVPSKPGEPPNEDTGVLRTNIETSMPAPLVAQVSSNAPYAADMEFGNSRVAERPHMRPARDRNKKKIRDLFATEMNRIVKSSG